MKHYFLFFSFLLIYNLLYPQRIIKGYVYSIDHEPLDSVIISYTGDSTILGISKKGFFKVKIKNNSVFLSFKYHNFEKVEFIPKNKTNLEIYFPFKLSMAKYKKNAKTYHIKSRSSLSISEYRTKILMSSTETPISHISEQTPQPGILTAGEVNDFQKWKLWQDITDNQLKDFINIWKIYPHKRFTVQVADKNNLPIINAIVKLVDNQGNTEWIARTDNTGKAELWANMFLSNQQKQNKNYQIILYYKQKIYRIKQAKTFYEGINKFTIPNDTQYPDTVDIAFVIDITGSMADELEYLKAEISDIISKVRYQYQNLIYRVAIVVYKDIGDDIIYKYCDFSTNIDNQISFLKKYKAGGGGDYPEAVDSALFVAVNKLSWSNKGRTRIAFLILDAPPHTQPVNIFTVNKAIYKAAEKGIRIVPLSCSGINKSTEYLLRSMALATNGTYTFLTDDSGIGNPHIKPTTDKYNVELMHDLFIRIIKKFIETPEKLDSIQNADIKDTSFVSMDTTITNIDTNQTEIFKEIIKFYPNPTSGNLTVEILTPIKEFYIGDITGKLLKRYKVNARIMEINIGEFTDGIYFIMYYKNERWYTAKVLLRH